ncbi:MAG: hypothetical protein R3F60_04645 [bacterium]
MATGRGDQPRDAFEVTSVTPASRRRLGERRWPARRTLLLDENLDFGRAAERAAELEWPPGRLSRRPPRAEAVSAHFGRRAMWTGVWSPNQDGEFQAVNWVAVPRAICLVPGQSRQRWPAGDEWATELGPRVPA